MDVTGKAEPVNIQVTPVAKPEVQPPPAKPAEIWPFPVYRRP